MNSSSCLLPPELMFTVTDEWSDRCQCGNPSCNIAPSVQWSKSPCDTRHRCEPEQHQQHPDYLATWQFSSRSSLNVHCSFDDVREEPSAEVPDLSHTPFSCDSSVSGSASQSLDSFAGDDFAHYAPDDPLLSREFDLSACHFPSPHFLLPSFSPLDPIDNDESTIHSPKPIFGYNTFEFTFDLDRPHSGDIPVAMSRHKRDRDPENGFEDIALPPKRRKLSGDAPGFFSLYPDPYRDISFRWDSCSPVDPSYPDGDVFSMEQLLNCTVDWAEDAWPNLPVC